MFSTRVETKLWKSNPEDLLLSSFFRRPIGEADPVFEERAGRWVEAEDEEEEEEGGGVVEEEGGGG